MQEVDFVNAISPFVPNESIPRLWNFFDNNLVHLKIARDRKTKYGDFRDTNAKNRFPRISINGGLNQYSFLITLLHEIAHFKVFEKYKRRVKPHGIEWKFAFQNTMAPYINGGIFPHPLEDVLRWHMQNPKASTHGDINLLRCLNTYDNKKLSSNSITLEEIGYGAKFAFRGHVFEKREKRRTRYMCVDFNSNKKYTISALATVEVV